MAPKVFVSHASEDKDRFVTEFATKLRSRGVDAWLDKWEMLPGDSLVDKIYEEGIKEAAAVIVVLSNISVQKPWVREELNAAVVKRINKGSKLIPIVLDDCAVPEALSSILWEPIKNLNDYGQSFDRIVAQIFGANEKPPIGEAPGYIKAFATSIGGLTNMDSLVLKIACDDALQHGDTFINPVEVFALNTSPLVPPNELNDSLEMLEQNGYIKLTRHLGPVPYNFRVTTFGFDKYANQVIPNYQQTVGAVVSEIVNKQAQTNEALTSALGVQRVLIDHILDVLAGRGHIKISKALGGRVSIYNVSPSLKRLLNGG